MCENVFLTKSIYVQLRITCSYADSYYVAIETLFERVFSESSANATLLLLHIM